MRLVRGVQPLSIQYYRRDGHRYERGSAAEIADAGFDLKGFRSDGLVLAELAKGPLIPNIFALRVWLRRGQRKLLGKT
jgi:hypothetical protein